MNIRDYDAEDVLAIVLGAGTCDVRYFLNKLNEFDLDFEDVQEEANSMGRNDFNSLMYCCFDLAGRKFMDAVIDYVKENNLTSDDIDEDIKEQFGCDIKIDLEKLENFEMNIYVNYLDSSFDCLLENYDLSEFDEENLINFLVEFFELDRKVA